MGKHRRLSNKGSRNILTRTHPVRSPISKYLGNLSLTSLSSNILFLKFYTSFSYYETPTIYNNNDAYWIGKGRLCCRYLHRHIRSYPWLTNPYWRTMSYVSKKCKRRSVQQELTMMTIRSNHSKKNLI